MTTATAQPVLLRATPAAWPYYRRSIPVDDGRFDELPRQVVLVGDALEQLRRLPSASVDCCVTSPPYFRLRDYGVTGQLGLEDHVDAWVAHLLVVLDEVARVLKPTGSLWLNLGDSFSRALRYGAPPKSLLLAPERLVLALLGRGWIVRNKVVWAKPNPMPHSVRDRLNTAHEPVYFLTRSGRYFFDLDAIREPHRSTIRPAARTAGKFAAPDRSWAGPLAGKNDGLIRAKSDGPPGHALGRNPGDIWALATGGYRGAHFATFPERLVTRPILATCPERVCLACGKPWRRDSRELVEGERRPAGSDAHVRRYPSRWTVAHLPGALRPGCDCSAGDRPGVVLDPFFGAGTVGVVAERLARDWLGIELNPAYARLAKERILAARQGAHGPP